MGKNDKKGGDKQGGKGKGGDKEQGGKSKGAQSINVRHILVRSLLVTCFQDLFFFFAYRADAEIVREACKEGRGSRQAQRGRQVR